ncbi:TIR domain-containing protein [Cellulomonas sp. URHD0024]|uniref:TIR domain-containing protein n=1 Tax=Cellulomonas sp. URHD0024 TaxID=1302620 RepID=UPI00040EBBAB|nr:TIR domain-containing protein [Cellulomonas sp. URHD0024]
MLFASYSSKDLAAVKRLVDDLGPTRFDVWFDQELRGGDDWWNEILGQIATCEVFIFALSDNSLRSKPCGVELAYAQALGAPVLPVQVGSVANPRLNPFANLHIIPYVDRAANAGIQLISALEQKSARPWTPTDPPPARPPSPYAIFRDLSAQVAAPSLTYAEQVDLFRQLRDGLDSERDESAGEELRTLMRDLRKRPDLAVRISEDIDRVLAVTVAQSVHTGSAADGGLGASTGATPVAATGTTTSNSSNTPTGATASTASTATAGPANRSAPNTTTGATTGAPASNDQRKTSAPPTQTAWAPGWYPDPSGTGQRFWDGARWTEFRHEAPRPVAPGGRPSPPPARPPEKSNTLSIVAMVLSLTGWWGIIPAVFAIRKREPMATAALVVSLVVGIPMALIWIGILANSGSSSGY